MNSSDLTVHCSREWSLLRALVLLSGLGCHSDLRKGGNLAYLNTVRETEL